MANFLYALLPLLYILSALPHPACSVNVLAVLPSVWKSHYLFGRRLLQQIVETPQGNYSVTLISPHAQEYPVQQKIREIEIEGLRENWHEMGLPLDVEQARQHSIMEHFTRLMYAGATNVDLLLGDAKVRKLLRSGEKFDLLVVDLFLSDSLLGLANFYQIPTVVLSPTGANTWLDQMLGNPQNSAMDPSIFLPYSERMSLWQRCVNTLMRLFEKLTYNFFHMISQEAVYNKHFNPLCQLANATLPHHRDLTKNLSLVLINSHPIIQYPRAYLPNVLEIAGAHLYGAEQPLELPMHMAYFIESAPKGVVYVSLGADSRTVDLAREKLDILLDVISEMKDYKFLIKWETLQFYATLPENAMISEWWPQEAILAHPNVKLFISTCGLMSIIEAINGLTPILAIPIYPEQEVNARRLKRLGISHTMSFDDFAYDQLRYGIETLATNESYAQKIREMSRLLNSGYGKPIAKIIHYIELILSSEGGGEFLKSHANELNFMRAELVDVIAIIVFGIFVIIAVPFLVTCCILRRSYINQTTLQKQQQQQQQQQVQANSGQQQQQQQQQRVGGRAATRRRKNSVSGIAALNDTRRHHGSATVMDTYDILKPPSSPSSSSTTSTVSTKSTASSADMPESWKAFGSGMKSGMGCNGDCVEKNLYCDRCRAWQIGF